MSTTHILPVVVGFVVAVSVRAATGTEVSPSVQALYSAECAGCHGEHGDGKGEADPSLSPPPRDFTRGKFKLRSTNPRDPVTVDELFETITNGMPGSAMPSFRFLTDNDRRALAQLVRSLGVHDAAASASPIVVSQAPPTDGERVTAGRKQYEQLGCTACHGTEGKGDGPAAAALQDEWRNPDPPRNLVSDPFRGGDSDRAWFLRLSVGMPGTPMPGYAEATDTNGLWDLVAYLKSIRNVPAPPGDASQLGEHVVTTRHCRACHQLGGTGGSVGPALDQITERRSKEWLTSFLANPRPEPKVYPELRYRMPQLYLTPNEVAAVIDYLAQPQ